MAFTTSQLNAGNTGTSAPTVNVMDQSGKTQLCNDYPEDETFESNLTVHSFMHWLKTTVENNDCLSNITRFKRLLKDERLANLVQHLEFNRIFTKMLNDIAKYVEFLKEFIQVFALHNHIFPNSISIDQQTERTEGAPLHFSARQLNEDFIDWLLEQPNTEINLRNKSNETALAILCKLYDSDTEHDRKGQILILISNILSKGATFNIYLSDEALPFDYLQKYKNQKEVAQIIDLHTTNNCVLMTNEPFKKKNLDTVIENQSKTRDLKFYSKTSRVQVIATVELLEIFIRFKKRKMFEKHFEKFEISNNNVKRVITLLLQVACGQNCSQIVEKILEKASDTIFMQKKTSPVSLLTVEGNIMVHQQELGGLLKTVCLNGNFRLLQTFLGKVCKTFALSEGPLLLLTLEKGNEMRQNSDCQERIESLKNCMKELINHDSSPVYMEAKDSNGNTALHLALKYNFDDIAHLILKICPHLLFIVNCHYKLPSEFGSLSFIPDYLNNCISLNSEETELVFDARFLQSTKYEILSDSSPSPSLTSLSYFIKPIENLQKELYLQYCLPHNGKDMKALRLISEYTNRKEILSHALIKAYIDVKWKRLHHLLLLNLLLMIVILLTLIFYRLSSGAWQISMFVCMIVAGFIFFILEVFLIFLLRRSYFTKECIVKFIILLMMIIAPVCYFFRKTSFKCQCELAEYFTGILCFEIVYVFGTIFRRYFFNLKMITDFTWKVIQFNPLFFLLKSAADSLHFFPQKQQTPAGATISTKKSNLINENEQKPENVKDSTAMASESTLNDASSWFSNVRESFSKKLSKNNLIDPYNKNSTAQHKTLITSFIVYLITLFVMTIGENILSKSRQQHEFESILQKMRVIERFERAIEASRSRMPQWLQRMYRDPWCPCPFIEKYDSVFSVKLQEQCKIEIKPIENENSAVGIPIYPGLPRALLDLCIPRFKIVLYMTLERSIVDEALKIVKGIKEEIKPCNETSNRCSIS